MTYAVNEAFLTLQGEGVQAGSRAVFLRFAGCNLWSGREAEENRVARRDVGHGNAIADAVLRHVDVTGQRRSAEGAEVEGQDDVPVGELSSDPSRRLELDAMPLIIIDGQRNHAEPPFPRNPRAHHGIQPTRQQHDRLLHSLNPSLGAAQNQPA